MLRLLLFVGVLLCDAAPKFEQLGTSPAGSESDDEDSDSPSSPEGQAAAAAAATAEAPPPEVITEAAAIAISAAEVRAAAAAIAAYEAEADAFAEVVHDDSGVYEPFVESWAQRAARSMPNHWLTDDADDGSDDDDDEDNFGWTTTPADPDFDPTDLEGLGYRPLGGGDDEENEEDDDHDDDDEADGGPDNALVWGRRCGW